MSSHFSCIGFPVRQMSEYEALMREAAAKGGGDAADPGEPISGAFPVRSDLVNFPLVRARLRVGDVVPIEFCGIAHEAALYEDAGAYETAGRVQYQPPMRSFLSLSHFAADEPEGEPEATALISGIIDDAHLLTNPK